MGNVWAWWAAIPRWKRWCGGFLVLVALALWAAVRAWLRRPTIATTGGDALPSVLAKVDDEITKTVEHLDLEKAKLEERQRERTEEANRAWYDMEKRAADRDAAHRAVDAAGGDVDRINAVLYNKPRGGPGDPP